MKQRSMLRRSYSGLTFPFLLVVISPYVSSFSLAGPLTIRHEQHARIVHLPSPILGLYPVVPDASVDDLQATASDDYIQQVVEQTIRYKPQGTIIRPYRPERLWLWRRWKGTILQHGSPKVYII